MFKTFVRPYKNVELNHAEPFTCLGESALMPENGVSLNAICYKQEYRGNLYAPLI
jgi:hypothetical protein